MLAPERGKKKRVSCFYVFRMFGVLEKYFRILHSLTHTQDINGIISSYSHMHTRTHSHLPPENEFLRAKFIISLDIYICHFRTPLTYFSEFVTQISLSSSHDNDDDEAEKNGPMDVIIPVVLSCVVIITWIRAAEKNLGKSQNKLGKRIWFQRSERLYSMCGVVYPLWEWIELQHSW